MPSRRFVAGAIAALALAGAAPAVAPAAKDAPPVASAAHSCSSGYTHAVINGAHKCLRRGQYCAIGADAQYHRYGYHCHRSSRDSNGDYHLT